MATKGIGTQAPQLRPAVLELYKLSGRDLQEEVAKSRIMEAVQRHIREDLGLAAIDIDFTLSFSLSL